MTKAQTTSATNTAEPEEDRPTMLHHTVPAWRSECHSTYIDARAVGTASVALSGLQTILAILMQHEADKGCDGPGRLILKSYSVEGLICAAESCAQVMEGVIDGNPIGAYAFDFDEPEGKAVEAFVWDQCGKAEARKRGKT